MDEVLQSAYKRFHSTETALLRVHDDIARELDCGRICLMAILDLSAAFDTIDKGILLHTLEQRFGVTGTALKWFDSYLTGRTQSVRIGCSESNTVSVEYGVPQGSVLGPILFNVYTSPTEDIMAKCNTAYHKYADDKDVYTFSDPNPAGIALALDSLVGGVRDLRAWLTVNQLMFNDIKTEFMCFAASQQHVKLCESLVLRVGDSEIKPSCHVRSLGVDLDSQLTMQRQVSSILSSCSFHLRQLGQIRSVIDTETCKSAVNSLITSRLDYCNSLLAGISSTQLARLQRLQNRSARLITLTRSREHITPILFYLHWLPVKLRVDFKILVLTFKCLHGLAPPYLKLSFYSPTRTLRSSDSLRLTVPRTKRAIGDRAFSSMAPRLWNDLPLALRSASTLSAFRSSLKTHLFISYFK